MVAVEKRSWGEMTWFLIYEQKLKKCKARANFFSKFGIIYDINCVTLLQTLVEGKQDYPLPESSNVTFSCFE